MTTYKQKTNNYGVHETHCCVLHGCKYGNENCPVENGEITQVYQCEDCVDIFKPNVKTIINLEDKEYSDLDNKNVYVCKKENYSLILGQLIEFNNKLSKKYKVVISITNGEEENLSDELMIVSLED